MTMNTVSSQSRNTNSVSNQATQFRASSKGSSSLAAKFDNISFTPPATLKQNFTKVAEQHTKAIREVATQGVGFVKGVGEVIGETASGIYTLSKNSAATYIDIVEGGKLDLADKIISTTTGHKIERPEWMPNRQRGVERLEQGGKVLQGVIENPKVLWQAVAAPIKEDWNAGRYGEAVGRGTAEAAGVVFGLKIANKLGSVAKASKEINHIDAKLVGHELISRQDTLINSLKPIKSPAREVLINEDKLIGTKEGLQSQKYDLFSNVIKSEHPDAKTKYLWTIDDRGVNIALESTPFPTRRGNIVHTNLSDKAYIGGEAWFRDISSVTINADSGRFGYSISKATGVTQEQWKATSDYWSNLGYNVKSIPLGEK